jgi:hypothetical protein
MAYPISEQILANIETTLEAMTVVGGYQRAYTVEREAKQSNTPADGKLIIYVGDQEEQPNPPLMHDEWLMPVAIACYGPISDSSSDATSRRIGQYASDVCKALAADLHRGNLAVNTHIRGVDMSPQSAPPTALVKIEVQYRTLYNDPFSQ